MTSEQRHRRHSPYIQIVEAGTSPSGKTKIWHVVNTNRDDLLVGVIRWHGAWRRYVFEQEGILFYDQYCLLQIADFLEEKTMEHIHARR